METVDDEFAAAAKDFMKRAVDDDQPFFVWLNTSHMHFITHPKPESKGQAGRWQSDYHDTMIDHDKLVGEVVAYLDELGIAPREVAAFEKALRAEAFTLLYRRRNDAVPKREKHQLGRRLSRADGRALAGPNCAGLDL